ncbi:sugar phosphate isomerase/epimerase family protein [Nocardioides sp.]|uniref:sugar phosphate isomerase/epimerase family protein n=1 Tax=Nocardioides sp. TaxID=35761 RepID=UPI0037843014
MSLEDVIDEAADLGAAHLQMNTATLAHARSPLARDVRARCEDRSLVIRLTGSPIGSDNHRGDIAAAVAGLEADLALAYQLGSGSLMVYSGVYRPDLLATPERMVDETTFLRSVLGRATGVASDLGVRVEVENASDFKSRELLELVHSLPEGSVGTFLDLTNPYNVLEDPIQAVERLAPTSSAGHVKDFALESIYTDDRYHRLGVSLRFKLPGEGASDVRGAIHALRRSLAGRTFHLAIEGLDTDPRSPVMKPRLEASLAFLRRCLDG